MIQHPKNSSFWNSVLLGVLTVVCCYTLQQKIQAERKKRAIQKEYGQDVVEPPYVSSWIPFLGKAPEMGKDPLQFIRKYSQKLDTPVFTCLIAGKTCHFIGDSHFVGIIYDKAKHLEGQSLKIYFFEKIFGIPPEISSKSYANPEHLKDSQANYRRLLTKEMIEPTVQTAQDIILQMIQQEFSEDQWTEVALHEMVFRAIHKATYTAFVSDAMADPSMLPYFREFDKGIGKAIKGTPKFLLKDFVEGRNKLLEVLRGEEHKKTVKDFLRSKHESDAKNGITPEESHAGSLALSWASLGNTIPSIFWVIAYMLTDDSLRTAAQKDLERIQLPQGESTTFTLEELDQMAALDSAFHEVLRMGALAVSPRDIKEDIVLEVKSPTQKHRYLLPKGTRIMGNVPTLHMDPEIYANPYNFQWDRFLKDSNGDMPVFTKDGKRIDAWRPFGGGQQLCPGRKFAMYECKAYACLLLSMLEIRIKPGETVPTINPHNGGVGAIAPEHDVLVQVRRKK
ncbi:25-hydroxycholesterol 7-alpha-hydroxylase (Fragment) [Seminavis robusta]|uniref:25-hydroxycholesterol 7-alpha-hydroxylase n=1 Tax=Seminavis robusta TaxID=568900 RepID=A0A9N8D791_9STRA